MDAKQNSDARTATLELTLEELDDLEWALGMARHSMTKASREAGRNRDMTRRENALDARQSFDELQGLVAEAKRGVDF